MPTTLCPNPTAVFERRSIVQCDGPTARKLGYKRVHLLKLEWGDGAAIFAWAALDDGQRSDQEDKSYRHDAHKMTRGEMQTSSVEHLNGGGLITGARRQEAAELLPALVLRGDTLRGF